MSRTDTIAMSAAVLVLAVLIVSFASDKASPSTLQWGIGIALGFAVIAFFFLSRLPKRTNVQQTSHTTQDHHDETIAREWDERKSAMMAHILGEEHDRVMHAIIPFAVGGGLDLYYYPNGIPGTAIATKELCEMPGKGSANKLFENYELVMFTRHPVSLDQAKDQSTPFGRAHHSINAILNRIARYSAQATLNPNETCEFPADMKAVGGKCLIFDAYGTTGSHAEFGLLAIIEIHRSEMDYARQHGGTNLINKLKEAGYYPYSDMERPAVA